MSDLKDRFSTEEQTKLRNPIKIFKGFLEYRRLVKLNKTFFEQKYGLNIDRALRLWTVMDLNSVPSEITSKLTYFDIKDREFRKYLKSFSADLPKIDMFDMVNLYDVAPNDARKTVGITFGYKHYNNVLLILWLAGLTVLTVAAITALLIFIF